MGIMIIGLSNYIEYLIKVIKMIMDIIGINYEKHTAIKLYNNNSVFYL